jgi:hypothetical protein
MFEIVGHYFCENLDSARVIYIKFKNPVFTVDFIIEQPEELIPNKVLESSAFSDIIPERLRC